MDLIKELRKRRSRIYSIAERYQDMGNPIPEIILEHAGRMAFLPTHLASASTIDYAFMGEAARKGLIPVWTSFCRDVFQPVNKRKKMFLTENDQFGNVTKIANPNHWNGKKMSEIVLDSGQSLRDYHLEKWEGIPGEKFHVDFSDWLQFFGKAEDYYYHVEVLNTFFGVKFWPSNLPLYNEGEKEKLVSEIMEPAKNKVFQEFDLQPLEHHFVLSPFSTWN